MTNEERARLGAETIHAYLDREEDGALSPFEAATDAVTNILHAICEADELQAEELLRLAKYHFVAECDEENPGDLAEEAIHCEACGCSKEQLRSQGVAYPVCCCDTNETPSGYTEDWES